MDIFRVSDGQSQDKGLCVSNSGAKAALKGYRLQTLYILSEILKSKNSKLIFQPEGNEDLAVYQDEKLVKAVQVKARSTPLVLSNFIEDDKKDTFIHRIVNLMKGDEAPRFEVISFGAIGNEIESAWSVSDINKEENKKNIRRKLINLNVTDFQIDLLFKNLVWTSVLETDLHQKVSKYLQQTLASGSIEHALSLLTSWIYVASEQQTKITQEMIFEKIRSVGKYFAEREAHHHEWFNSITPLESNTTIDKKRLEEEYYRGVSPRFSHIQANIDIPRMAQLIEIDNQFAKSQTVIVHGASGQGKTSLAYRYLYEYVPEPWRLHINFIDDRSHAQKIALAIADQLSIFDATLYLYIDVSPRDPDWTALVKALLEKPNVKILVSIRQEDLARQNISNEQLGFPALVPLRLSKEDAENIYNNLVVKGVAKAYPSFKQAWLGFGGNGSLLEYVFFLTQSESLKERLRSQVKRLRAEVSEGKLESSAIDILLASAVATSYEARVDIKSLVDCFYLRDPKGTFNLFEDEYLIRRSDDQIHIEAIHPIRSKILVEVLVDPVFSPWVDSALFVMPTIPETDLETFLLYSFVERPQDFESLLRGVKGLNIKSWGAVAAIGRALLWFGIHNHTIENKHVINAARGFAGGDGCSLLLHADIGGATDQNPIEELISILGKNNPTASQNARALRQQISDPTVVYQYIKEWLTHIPNSFLEPDSDRDWSGMGEVILWMGRLGIAKELDLSWLLTVNIEVKFKDISPLADLTVGLYSFSPDFYLSFIGKHKNEIISIFQKSTKTIWLEQQEGNQRAHYIIPDIHLDSDNLRGTYLNEMSVARATILRKLFPDQERFGAQGYGHQNILVELPFDDSNKNIIKSAIPLPQFVRVNSTWINYADYIFRPDDWLEYVNNILSIRERIVTSLIILTKTLVTYFKKRESQALIAKGKIDSEYWEHLSKINWQLTKLPKLAVDPWGITSEGTLSCNQEPGRNTANFISMQNDSKKFRESLRDYIFPLVNFFSQSHFILIFNGIIGRLPEDRHQDLYKKAECLGHPFDEHKIHLSCFNFNDANQNLERFQNEFRALFHDIVPYQKIKELEEKEREKFRKSWPLWYQFAHHPEKYWKDSPESRAASIITNLKNELITSISSSLRNMSNPSMNASILSNCYDYGGKRALWVKVEIDNLTEMEYAFIETIQALTKAVKPVNFSDLKYFVMTNLWDSFVIVPTIDGGAISSVAWVVLAGKFFGDHPVINEEKEMFYLSRSIPSESLVFFGLKNKVEPLEKILEDIESEVIGIFSIVNHMHCFEGVAKNANETGTEILGKYLLSLIEPLTKHINSARKNIEKAREYIFEGAEALNHTLDECVHAIQPYEECESDHINISLSDCRLWADLLQESLIQLQIFKNRCMRHHPKKY